MRILDKYILKELSSPFLFGVVAFTSVFIGTNTLFRIAQYVTQYGASATSAAKLFFYSLPSIIVLTFPMSMLLSSLMTFGRLSASSEIIAMKSGGISFYRLATPVFIAAFLVSLATVVINEKLVPVANRAYQYTVRVEIQKNFQPKLQEHIVVKGISGGNMERLIYARNFDRSASAMSNVTMQEFENDKPVRMQTASKAIWGNERWIMYDGTTSDLLNDGKIEKTSNFKEQIMPLAKTPEDISQEQKRLDEMTINELKQHIKILRMENIDSSRYQVELHQRVAVPMACFIFSFIGAPLGLSGNRSTSSIGLGLSVVIIFIYYTIMTVFAALGQGGAIPAATAAWIPNVVALLAGVYLVRRAAK